eukprot:m.162450 g.162450  ORF g.162450 m.162450 type:complete len:546 (-) comp15203_c0_seq1:100-1737(-)
MADSEISAPSTTLNERLLSENERGDAPVSSAMSPMRKKVLLGLLATVAVACLVVGIVAASGRTTLSPSSSSTSGSSFAAVSQTNLQTRPTFAKPIGSLANAPEPSIVHSTATTETAVFHFNHSSTTAQGNISHTSLRYNVSKVKNAHCPAKHESVLAIDCLPTRIRISFTNASKAAEYAAQWVNNTILFLRHEWGCGSHVRRFVSQPILNGRLLFVNTVNASITDAFRHANISFFSNHSDADGPVQLQTVSRNATKHNSHRRSLWGDITGFLSSASNAVADLVTLAVTGDLQNTWQPFSAQYTVPATTLSNSNQYGSVNIEYSGSVSVGTNVELNIQDYSLSSFSATASGSLSASATATVTASASYSQSDSQAITSSITVASGSIPVFGVEIPVNLLVQVFAGYQASGEASASLSGTATAQGSVSGGVSYTLAKGITTPGTGSLTGTLSYSQPTLNVYAEALVYLAPQLYLQVAYLGGPTLTFVAYGDAVLPSGSCQVTQNIGVEVDAGAQISVSIPHLVSYQKSTSPVTVYGPSILWNESTSFC